MAFLGGDFPAHAVEQMAQSFADMCYQALKIHQVDPDGLKFGWDIVHNCWIVRVCAKMISGRSFSAGVNISVAGKYVSEKDSHSDIFIPFCDELLHWEWVAGCAPYVITWDSARMTETVRLLEHEEGHIFVVYDNRTKIKNFYWVWNKPNFKIRGSPPDPSSVHTGENISKQITGNPHLIFNMADPDVRFVRFHNRDPTSSGKLRSAFAPFINKYRKILEKEAIQAQIDAQKPQHPGVLYYRFPKEMTSATEIREKLDTKVRYANRGFKSVVNGQGTAKDDGATLSHKVYPAEMFYNNTPELRQLGPFQEYHEVRISDINEDISEMWKTFNNNLAQAMDLPMSFFEAGSYKSEMHIFSLQSYMSVGLNKRIYEYENILRKVYLELFGHYHTTFRDSIISEFMKLWKEMKDRHEDQERKQKKTIREAKRKGTYDSSMDDSPSESSKKRRGGFTSSLTNSGEEEPVNPAVTLRNSGTPEIDQYESLKHFFKKKPNEEEVFELVKNVASSFVDVKVELPSKPYVLVPSFELMEKFFLRGQIDGDDYAHAMSSLIGVPVKPMTREQVIKMQEEMAIHQQQQQQSSSALNNHKNTKNPGAPKKLSPSLGSSDENGVVSSKKKGKQKIMSEKDEIVKRDSSQQKEGSKQKRLRKKNVFKQKNKEKDSDNDDKKEKKANDKKGEE